MAAAVAALRVAYAFDLPWNTGDVVRHLLYGVAVLEHGLGVADVPLAALSETMAAVPWSDRAFNYPPVALLFDTAVAAVSPRIAVYKLALTALEAGSAVLLWRITGSRWLGLLYWASPLSIWWASHEGQAEPVQNVLALAAILAMVHGRRRWAEGGGGRRRWVGWALLALAIQAKGFAVFLLPWFVVEEVRAVRRDRTGGGPGIGQAWGFLLGLVPLAMMLPVWSPANVLASAGLVLNPWYWNPWADGLAGFNPGWMTAVGQAATWALLGAGVWLSVAGRAPAAAGPTAFVVALKSVTHAQPWYLLTLPALWAPLASGRGTAGGVPRGLGWLAAILVLWALMDPQSIVQIVAGEPVGFTMGSFYAGVDAWTLFDLPVRPSP